MNSMAAILAADTTTPPDPATQDGGWVADVLSAVWTWTTDTVPGGSVSVIAAVVVLAMLVSGDKKAGHRSASDWQKTDRAVFTAIGGLFRRLFRVLWATIRFYGGRELRGEPRSTATFLRAGTRTQQQQAPAVSMGAVAAAQPRVSLVKKRRRQPSPWARNAAAWIESYRGRGAAALDRAVRAALWAARTAGRAWRAGQQFARRVRAVYAVVAPVVRTLAAALRAWPCWPYAARGAARMALTAAVIGLAVPAWRVVTILALVLALVAAVVLAAKVKPKKPGDDEVYGPRIWAVLREDLKLPEDEPRENWVLLPERLADPGARVVIRLPWIWRGSETDRADLSALVNSRLPGEWVARVSLTGETFTAVYTHKPPPKPPVPAPQPPAMVDIMEPRVWEILDNLKPEEFLLGFDENNEAVIRKMSGELSHWAYSVGSGGGKSTTLQWLAVQMVMKRGTILGIDPKLISLKPLAGVEAVFLYADPENAKDMRRALEWSADVVAARFYEVEQGIATDFPPFYLFLEETNELSGLLKAIWKRIRVKTGEDKDPEGDPIWEDVIAYMLRFGRAANVHIIAVFQDFKDNQFGGTSLQPLFRLKVLGNYDPRQWERITGLSKTIMPPNVDKAGRMVTVEEGKPVSFQTPYFFIDTEDGGKRPATEAEAIELYGKLYRQLRERYEYSDSGLYSEPPANSPRGVPRLLRDRVGPLSHDTAADGPLRGSEGGLSDETAGRGVTPEGSVTPGVTGQRDRLYLVPGQGGTEGSEGSLDAPTPLTIAEIAREMQARGYVIEAGLIRTHKSRRDKGMNNGFPAGIMMDGTERFFLPQLIAFYEQRGIEKRENSEEEAGQGSVI